jgi:hypothetical protein
MSFKEREYLHLYQLKHLNIGNFLKYSGLFSDCKIVQVLSPPTPVCLWISISILVGNFTKQQVKEGKESEIQSFCAASPRDGFREEQAIAIR